MKKQKSGHIRTGDKQNPGRVIADVFFHHCEKSPNLKYSIKDFPHNQTKNTLPHPKQTKNSPLHDFSGKVTTKCSCATRNMVFP